MVFDTLELRDKLEKIKVLMSFSKEGNNILDKCVEILKKEKKNDGVNRSVVAEMMVRMLYEQLNQDKKIMEEKK